MKTARTTIIMKRQAGAFAEDKDVARAIRLSRVLPGIKDKGELLFDFTGVTNTTQSFMHACIAEAFRLTGPELLSRTTFKGCNDDVQSIIATVVEYSIRAYELSREQPVPPAHAIVVANDIPQADNLHSVRLVCDAVALGNTSPYDIAKSTGFSYRHVHYRMHSGRILGFVNVFGRSLVGPTDAAYELLDTTPGSVPELKLFERAVTESPIMKRLVPDLLTKRDYSKLELTKRIEQRSNLSASTAARRAQCLLAWRKYILHAQPTLFPPLISSKRTRGPARTAKPS